MDRYEKERDWLKRFSDGVSALKGGHVELSEDVFRSLLEEVEAAPEFEGMPPVLGWEPSLSLIPLISEQLAEIEKIRGNAQKVSLFLRQALQSFERNFETCPGV